MPKFQAFVAQTFAADCTDAVGLEIFTAAAMKNGVFWDIKT
jgi:hypothetical protein